MINEEFLKEDITTVVTGEQIANMFGMGDIYRRGKEAIAHDNEMMEAEKSRFVNLVERMNKTHRINNEIID